MQKPQAISFFDIEHQSDSKDLNPAEILSEQIYSVSDAVALINDILAPLTLTIEGEVSGFKIAQGKFVFFDVKDQSAVLNCFMMMWELPFKLEDGMSIRLQGSARIRAASGRFSLTVKSLELLGEGALQKAFLELQRKLDGEGLFDPKWKKPLPVFPKTIGLVTSKSGDALQDMLRIMRNRAGGLSIHLAHAAVQGQLAVAEISSAIQFFNQHHPVDVIIVARGGGSLEDLQAFNSEPVVRSIFASKIPIVTGVGHEPDVTLVDLVADVRAATPTNAAEIVTPNFDQLELELQQYAKHLVRGTANTVLGYRHSTDQMLHRLHKALTQPKLQTDTLKERLLFQLKQQERMFWQKKALLSQMTQRLESLPRRLLESADTALALAESRLTSLNPDAVLARGYSIATRSNGSILTAVSQTNVGEEVNIRLSDGTIGATVVTTHPLPRQ